MKIYFLLLVLSFLISCSLKEVTQEKNDYVFDKVDLESTELDQNLNQSIPEPTKDSVTIQPYYLVQIGAFTTEQRAQRFAEKSRKMLNEEIIVAFSNKINLYLVQLGKKFLIKSEAEIVRDNLRLFPEFQDSWIIFINE